MVKEVDKIDHVIQALVDLSGDDMSKADEKVSISEAIDELVSVFGAKEGAANNIEFIKDMPSQPLTIRANRKEFDEILLNIIQNSIHAIEGGGHIVFRATDKGATVELEIKDNGCGMDAGIVKNIFNPFYTTKSKGFGLGLFVVNELVRRNKGTIRVASKVGEGTSFILELERA